MKFARRTIALDPFCDRMVKRVWREMIRLGWPKPSYSQALRVILVAFLYREGNIIRGNEPFDIDAILRTKEYVFKGKDPTEEDVRAWDELLERLKQAGYLELPPTSHASGP